MGDEYMRSAFGAAKWKKWLSASNALMFSTQRRLRTVTAHTQVGDFQVSCAVGVTTEEFVETLRRKVGPLPRNTQVYFIPPPDLIPDPKELRRLAFEAARIVYPCVPLMEEAHTKLTAEQEKALADTMIPIAKQHRIGARIAELWIHLPASRPGARMSERGHGKRMTQSPGGA